MTTKNKKISAYLPEVVYECFDKFAKDHKLSFSEATIKLFAQYFGINLSDSSTKSTTGGLLDRMIKLEQIVTELSEKVDFIKSTSKLPDVLANSGLPSEPTNELQNSAPLGEPTNNDLLINDENHLALISSLPGEQKSDPPAVLSDQLEIFESGNKKINSLLSSLPGEPLSNIEIKVKPSVLAQRLKTSEQYIRNLRAKYTTEKLTEWTTEKDPNRIGWQAIKEGKYLYYFPVGNLNIEQKINLQEWLRENQTEVDRGEIPVPQKMPMSGNSS